MDLHDRKESAAFYENRYTHGYMGHWSAFEKERLRNLILELKLPEKGKALDFGCGRGIFTAVIQEALPGWELYGCDISPEAIAFAQKQNSGIHFFVLGDNNYKNEKFSFIHSHHVLEHTFDEKITAKEMCAFAAQQCVMLHSLPCNHPGSLEYKISSVGSNGIDEQSGKFFFEDKAHMRRLNENSSTALFAPAGFRKRTAYYANQYYGALKWIAESGFGLVLRIGNPFRAKSAGDFFFLLGLLGKLKLFWFCFFTASAFEKSDRGRFYFLKKILQVFCFVFFFWFSIPVRSWLIKKAIDEWEMHRLDTNGSDLFLILERE